MCPMDAGRRRCHGRDGAVSGTAREVRTHPCKLAFERHAPRRSGTRLWSTRSSRKERILYGPALRVFGLLGRLYRLLGRIGNQQNNERGRGNGGQQHARAGHLRSGRVEGGGSFPAIHNARASVSNLANGRDHREVERADGQNKERSARPCPGRAPRRKARGHASMFGHHPKRAAVQPPGGGSLPVLLAAS